jgi:hypothetical protein
MTIDTTAPILSTSSPDAPSHPINDISGFFKDVNCTRRSIDWARRLPLEEIGNYMPSGGKCAHDNRIFLDKDVGYLFAYVVASVESYMKISSFDSLPSDLHVDMANFVLEMFHDRDEIRYVSETSIDHLIAVAMLKRLCANQHGKVHEILTPVVLDAFFDLKTVFAKIHKYHGVSDAVMVEMSIPRIVLAAMTSDYIDYESYYDIAYIATNTINANFLSAPLTMTMIQILAEITTAPNEVAECLFELGALSIFRAVVVLNMCNYAEHVYSSAGLVYGTFNNAANDAKVFEDVILGIGNLIVGADPDQAMAVVSSGIIPLIFDKDSHRVSDSLRVFIAHGMAHTGRKIGMLGAFCEETLFVNDMMDFLIRMSVTENRTDRKCATETLDIFSENCPMTVATAIGEYSSSLTSSWIRGIRKSARVLKRTVRRLRRAAPVPVMLQEEAEDDAIVAENNDEDLEDFDASVTTFDTATDYSDNVYSPHSATPSPVVVYHTPPSPPLPFPASDRIACPIAVPTKVAISECMISDIDERRKGYFIIENKTNDEHTQKIFNSVISEFRSAGAFVINVQSGPKLAAALKRVKKGGMVCVIIPPRLANASTVWNAIRDFVNAMKFDISFWVFAGTI